MKHPQQAVEHFVPFCWHSSKWRKTFERPVFAEFSLC